MAGLEFVTFTVVALFIFLGLPLLADSLLDWVKENARAVRLAGEIALVVAIAGWFSVILALAVR
jgi:hypothetical protein